MPQGATKLPTTSSCVAQLVHDFSTLPLERQKAICESLQEQEGAPAEALSRHLELHPKQVPLYQALIIDVMPYAGIARYLSAVDLDAFFKRNFHALLECLGGARTYNCLAAIAHLQDGDAEGRRNFHAEDGPAESPVAIPDDSTLKKYEGDFGAQMVSLGSIILHDSHSLIEAAQLRAREAEDTLKKERIKWGRTQERMAVEAQRAKARLAAEVEEAVGKTAKAEAGLIQQKLDEALKAHENTKQSLKSALARIEDIEEQGGATPERADEIRNELKREADQRIEDELSIALRPWLGKFLEMEREQANLQAARTLSSKALAMAKQEACNVDIIISWESDRERALKVLEQEMSELDSLMMRVIKPTPQLVKMHSDLLHSMLACRKQLNPTKPLGEVARALISGLKKVKDEELGEAAYAVAKLAEKGVFLGLEAETLIKIVEGERQMRYDLSHFKKSVLCRMIQRLHARQPVDILIDGYNYMFTAQQHFGDKFKLNRNADGEAVFGEAGRARLNAILLPLAEKFPHLEIHIFYDGRVEEKRNPHPRIAMWEPTYQRSGKGQADAEIAHVGLKRVRKGAMAVVVSNDKVVQRFADHFLSVRLFSDFIANH